MRRLALAMIAVLPLSAQQTRVTLDTDRSTVNFTLGDVLHTVHGVFRLIKGEFRMDLSTGKADGEIVVSAASGNSGSHARDGRMRKDILQADRYSEITFKPERIEGSFSLSGNSAIKLQGRFAIHGATHPLTVNVKSHVEGGKMSATANFEVPYVEWGMRDPSTLFLKVKPAVRIDIEAVGKIQ